MTRARFLWLLAMAACDDGPGAGGAKGKKLPERADSQVVAEVADVFAGIRAGEEQWKRESGSYLGLGSEAQPEDIVAFAKLRVRPSMKPPLRCRYAAIAGDRGDAPAEPLGKELYAAEPPAGAWFYLVARCGQFTFVQRSDSTEIVEKK